MGSNRCPWCSNTSRGKCPSRPAKQYPAKTPKISKRFALKVPSRRSLLSQWRRWPSTACQKRAVKFTQVYNKWSANSKPKLMRQPLLHTHIKYIKKSNPCRMTRDQISIQPCSDICNPRISSNIAHPCKIMMWPVLKHLMAKIQLRSTPNEKELINNSISGPFCISNQQKIPKKLWENYGQICETLIVCRWMSKSKRIPSWLQQINSHRVCPKCPIECDLMPLFSHKAKKSSHQSIKHLPKIKQCINRKII